MMFLRLIPLLICFVAFVATPVQAQMSDDNEAAIGLVEGTLAPSSVPGLAAIQAGQSLVAGEEEEEEKKVKYVYDKDKAEGPFYGAHLPTRVFNNIPPRF